MMRTTSIVGRRPARQATWWFLLPVLAGIAGAAWATTVSADRVIELPALPACSSANPQLTVLVPDVSESVIAPGGADPKGRSFDEAKLLARHLSEHRCTDDDRLAAVIFANRSVEVPPTALDSMSVIEAVMKRPPQDEVGGGTRLVPALERVETMLGRYPDHEATVIVLSDMQAEDPDELRPVLDRIERDNLHLVALGQHNGLFDEAFETVNILDAIPRGSVAKTLNDIIAGERTNP